jgi:glutamate decarboxylase
VTTTLVARPAFDPYLPAFGRPDRGDPAAALATACAGALGVGAGRACPYVHGAFARPRHPFQVNYLGGDMPTFALNFSRPGAQVVAQYSTFLRLGREGYRAVQRSTRAVACSPAERVAAPGDFRLLTRGDELPVFALTTADGVTADDVFDVSRRMRERGWPVPAYTFPPNREDLSVLRIVCRDGFSADLADLFLEDLTRLLPELRGQPHPLTGDKGAATAFHP